MDLFQQFRQHCAAEKLVQPGDRLLLAVSGGMDSCVMLDLFWHLKDEWQLQLAVGHVNHQLRGEESDEDEAFVKTLAQQAGLSFYSERVEVATHAQTNQFSLEAAARELRYQALENFRERWQGRAIVTAHTLDDQAETVLDHILRGCGLAGLTGMAAQKEFVVAPSPSRILKAQERRSGVGAVLSLKGEPLKGQLRTKIVRPLLPFSRGELEAYAKARQLQWREDRTNAEPRFRRNRLRHELLPLLKTRFNPKIAGSLQRLAAIAAAAENYFQAEAARCLQKIVKDQQPDKIILDLELFWEYFPIIQRYVIRAAMRGLVGEPVELTFAETARILALLQKTDKTGLNKSKPAAGKRYLWRKQVEVLVDHDGAVFQKLGSGETRSTPYASRLAIPVKIGQRCEIPGTSLAVLVEQKELPVDWRQQVHAHSQFVDAEKVQGELQARFPQPGDRFVPLRANDSAAAEGGSKKLSDFFTDLKVSRHRRRATPVLAGDHIIWICGYRIDNRCKITPATKSVLHLQLLLSSD
ncbi:MAG: tRNA lysidine(34) synthetase TilS [candidate division KSB1 bacterium]|nr:tRNA lysidine(34) synthetase TilS [candidate division KSB1 bacterium]MDZ7369039.1 tRNA lysidine(34) synthetase TilS [candidate division KSB1 bacterium]MDZ7407037.1 tRNA lysidine(34) synthetase TilS [candidate division KSB1 bacterium]